jgi:5-formyltetrahydrofolate cyclo-ligase
MNIDSSYINEQKKQIRKTVKEHKSKFDINLSEIASNKIFGELEKLPEFFNAKTVLAYWSLADEVNTHTFINNWYKTKRFLLPLVIGSELELRVFSGIQSMSKGPSFGIMEPINGDVVSIEEVDFAIIPGVAYDLRGNRLGRGKGYYDKLLSNKSIFKIGICFAFQVFPQIPVDRFDIPVDKVIFA